MPAGPYDRLLGPEFARSGGLVECYVAPALSDLINRFFAAPIIVGIAYLAPLRTRFGEWLRRPACMRQPEWWGAVVRRSVVGTSRAIRASIRARRTRFNPASTSRSGSRHNRHSANSSILTDRSSAGCCAANGLGKLIPPSQSNLARQAHKDPYVFDFLTLAGDAAEPPLPEYALRHLRKPARISSCKLTAAPPKELKGSLSTTEGLEAKLRYMRRP